jgi:hypothetical protein
MPMQAANLRNFLDGFQTIQIEMRAGYGSAVVTRAR